MLSKKIYSEQINYKYNENILYFDIETTGFNTKFNQVRMITYMYYKNYNRYVEIHFAQDKTDENLLLAEFIKLSKKFITLVHFNGNTFDIPFINKRLIKNNINFNYDKQNSIDLYSLIKSKYKFNSYKLKDIECNLNIKRNDNINGKEWTTLLKEYDSGNTKVVDILEAHNYEDVLNLEEIINKLELREEIESMIINYNQNLYFIKKINISEKNARIVLYRNYDTTIDIKVIKYKNIVFFYNEMINNMNNETKKKHILSINENVIYKNLNFILNNGGGTQI